jgi:hypothetical protein
VFCAGIIRAASFHTDLLAIRGQRSLLEKGRRSVPEELPAGCHPALIHFSLEFSERVSSIGLRVERVAGAGGEGKFAITQILRWVRKRPFRGSIRRGGEVSCGGF